MARDTASFDDSGGPVGFAAPFSEPVEDPRPPLTPEEAAFSDLITIGEGLRAVRLGRGLSLDDIILITRIRRAHLEAIEAMDLARLPSRPFATGYVRAYAEALGLDGNLAVAKFRADAPADDEVLPTPIGMEDEADPRRGLFISAGIAVLAAIVIWNIAQRAMSAREGPASDDVIEAAAIDQPVIDGAIALGRPLPPPVEATLPTPYVTPGLETFDPEVAAKARAEAAAQLAANPIPPTPYVARGPVYGVPATEPHLMLQAIREVTLVIRPQNGPIQDIRTLKEGESYRAPLAAGILIDVSMPSSMEYYAEGVLKGVLQTAVTPVTQLARAP